METVGAPTWEHSLKSLRQGGTIVVTGATGGHQAVTDLRRVFFLQLRDRGLDDGHPRRAATGWSGSGRATGVRPVVDTVLPLEDAARASAGWPAATSSARSC